MNKYLKVGENVKLSDDATRRICESMRAANRELAAEKAKKRRLWSCRAFKLAVVCASAALVCGAAIGTGIYFGVNERDKSDKSDYSVYYTPKLTCIMLLTSTRCGGDIMKFWKRQRRKVMGRF